MFEKHLILGDGNDEVLYLFIDYNYEFGKDFNTSNEKEKKKTIYKQVSDYIKKHHIDFKGTKVFLVVNGIIISSLLLANYNYSNSLKDEIAPKYQYVEYIKNFEKANLTNQVSNTNTETVQNNTSTSNEVTTNNNETKQVTSNTASQSITANKQVASSSSSTSTTTSSTPASTNNTTSASNSSSTPTAATNEQTVSVYRSSGAINVITLDDYIIGVVGAEMPASFQSEALKAQALTARTYTLKKLSQNQVLRDSDVNQVYKDVDQLKVYWGSSFDLYYNKVKNAVLSTKGEYITYNNDYIDAVYHSTSNGQTEASVAVWGNTFPYLVSVDSHWDLTASSYLRDTTIDINTVNTALDIDLNSNQTIEILARTPGNRIDSINISGKTFTGKQVRETLGLRSADFDIRIEGQNVIFTTRGYGHGVGMSQYGANGMAKEGYTYQQIISHYYPGTVIKG